MSDKRRRNARPSKYRPRSEAQKARRKALWEARAADREMRTHRDGEAALKARLIELDTALRDHGRGGVHGGRHVRPLDEIVDDAERLAVLKARVERLEALWSIDRRKRETRGKIIIGGALLAELIDDAAAGESTLFATLMDVLDRRVDTVRDRLTVRDLLGGAPLPLRPGGALEEPLHSALEHVGLRGATDELLHHSAMAEAVEDADDDASNSLA